MGEQHPTVEQMALFLRGSLGTNDTGRVVRHLLQGCARCRTAVQEARRKERPTAAGEPSLYDRAFARALSTVRTEEVALAHERVVAQGLVAILEDLPRDEQERRIRGEQRFQTWGLCGHLLEESRSWIFAGEPARAVGLAHLAVVVGESLDPRRYHRELIEDLQARAWAELGNAQRTEADFLAAQASFAEARKRQESGSRDAETLGRIMSLEASLLIDLGRWDEALELCDRTLELYRSLGSEKLIARTLVKKAVPLGYLDPMAAVGLFAEAEELISRSENLRLFLCARHNRIWFLNDAGHGETALVLLDESRSIYRQFPDDWMQLRLRWVEARIAFGLGHLDEAESALSLLWSFVFERRLRLELALVTLDLTTVYVAKGEMQKAWRTAGRLVPLFQSWGVHPEAMEAWLVLQRAFAAEKATAGLIREIGRYLQRSWKNPELPFRESED